MKIEREDTVACVIDLQEKLVPAMEGSEQMIRSSLFLLKALKALKIPVFQTTQYKKGLGENLASIRELAGTSLDKKSFGILGEPAVEAYLLGTGRKTVLVLGAETHICVLQSVLELLQKGYRVVLLCDCTASGCEADKKAALLRVLQEGAVITTAEAVVYELMGSCLDPAFKEITKLVKEHRMGREK